MEAKTFLEQCLASAGVADPSRALRASNIFDAIAEEQLRELKDAQITEEIQRLLQFEGKP